MRKVSKKLPLPRKPRLLLVCTLLVLSEGWGRAQQPEKPYAAIDRNAVNYAGPGRESAHDLTGTEVRIGLVAPLAGPRKAEGEALLSAARLALEDEGETLPNGRRLVLLARDESGPWGRASSEIVRLVVDDRVLALITSADGGAAHLAEQVANKIGVPVLTLSSDTTTTEINLPWIFRLGPTDAAQAHAFAQRIYKERGFTRVLLVTESDHDGRVGGEEFEKAAKETGGALQRLELNVTRPEMEGTVREIAAANPEAVVLWAGPERAAGLVREIRQAGVAAPVYLCRKAAQDPFGQMAGETCRSCSAVPPGFPISSGQVSPAHAEVRLKAGATKDEGELWVVGLRPSESSRTQENFERRYRQRTGSFPGNAALEAYDAVRILAAALRQSGPNRARLRDSLASLSNFDGASGTISFDHAGNSTTSVTLVKLP